MALQLGRICRLSLGRPVPIRFLARSLRVARRGVAVASLTVLLSGCQANLFPSPPPPGFDQGPAGKTPILGSPQVTVEQAQAWARTRGAAQEFIDVAPLFWQIAVPMGIRPEVAYAQSAKETNFGRFTGTVTPEHNNWCGLKTAQGGPDWDPNAHQRFATDADGVRACIQHLGAYAGVEAQPPIVDPRYQYVGPGTTRFGSARYVEDLGGQWAPSPDYGTSIVQSYLNPMMQLAGQ